MENFVDREFEEVEGGKYDERGFYKTPNGSFWDPDQTYFNREGFDNHGGRYNEEYEYVPGPGWVDEYMCYEDEVDEIKNFFENFDKNNINLKKAEN